MTGVRRIWGRMISATAEMAARSIVGSVMDSIAAAAALE
jgi:hypothetical protein